MRAALPALHVMALASLVGCNAASPEVRLVVSDVAVSCGPGAVGPCEVKARILSNFPRELLSVIAIRGHDRRAYLGVQPVRLGETGFRQTIDQGASGDAWSVSAEGYVVWPVGQSISVTSAEYSCAERAEGLPVCTVQGGVEYTERVKSLVAVEARLGDARAWGLAEVRDGKGMFTIDLPGSWSTSPPRKPDAVVPAGLVVAMRGAPRRTR